MDRTGYDFYKTPIGKYLTDESIIAFLKRGLQYDPTAPLNPNAEEDFKAIKEGRGKAFERYGNWFRENILENIPGPPPGGIRGLLGRGKPDRPQIRDPRMPLQPPAFAERPAPLIDKSAIGVEDIPRQAPRGELRPPHVKFDRTILGSRIKPRVAPIQAPT